MKVAPFALACGHTLDLAAPDLSGLSADEVLRAVALGLMNTCRYGGQIESRFSVAAHCLLGAQYLLDEIDGGDLDGETHAQVRLHFLLHDAAEGLGLCDIPTPLKKYLGEPYAWLEHLMLKEIYRAIGVPPPSDRIAVLVSALDLAALKLEQHVLHHKRQHHLTWVFPWYENLGAGVAQAWVWAVNEAMKEVQRG